MLVSPILDVYAVWHPSDHEGRRVADWLLAHFCGATYLGLIGGSIEVYMRSEPWMADSDAPRRMPFQAPTTEGPTPARYSAVVPVVGAHLLRAIANSESGWRDYLDEVVDAAEQDQDIGIFPLRLPGCGGSSSGPLGRYQAIATSAADDPSVLCREVAQQITQMIGGEATGRITVFCSHTKKHSVGEEATEAARIVQRARDRIAETHLAAFIDETDIQPGSDWQADLWRAVSSSSLLAIRTDLYASRDWCQKEMLAAKQGDRPIVMLHAVGETPERGSFLMDHVPVVGYQQADEESMSRSIDRAVNLLVDRTLRRALWMASEPIREAASVDWAPSEAPELVTAIDWIGAHYPDGLDGKNITIMHPDPPLGPSEEELVTRLFSLAGVGATVDIVTPRTYADRGGKGL
jgi:hypothetical protein